MVTANLIYLAAEPILVWFECQGKLNKLKLGGIFHSDQNPIERHSKSFNKA